MKFSILLNSMSYNIPPTPTPKTGSVMISGQRLSNSSVQPDSSIKSISNSNKNQELAEKEEVQQSKLSNSQSNISTKNMNVKGPSTTAGFLKTSGLKKSTTDEGMSKSKDPKSNATGSKVQEKKYTNPNSDLMQQDKIQAETSIKKGTNSSSQINKSQQKIQQTLHKKQAPKYIKPQYHHKSDVMDSKLTMTMAQIQKKAPFLTTEDINTFILVVKDVFEGFDKNHEGVITPASIDPLFEAYHGQDPISQQDKLIFFGNVLDRQLKQPQQLEGISITKNQLLLYLLELQQNSLLENAQKSLKVSKLKNSNITNKKESIIKQGSSVSKDENQNQTEKNQQLISLDPDQDQDYPSQVYGQNQGDDAGQIQCKNQGEIQGQNQSQNSDDKGQDENSAQNCFEDDQQFEPEK